MSQSPFLTIRRYPNPDLEMTLFLILSFPNPNSEVTLIVIIMNKSFLSLTFIVYFTCDPNNMI